MKEYNNIIYDNLTKNGTVTSGYAIGAEYYVCVCGHQDALNKFNLHMLVWMFILPFVIILFCYGNIAAVIYTSTKRTSSSRSRNRSTRSGELTKLSSGHSIDPRTKRLLGLIIALVVR